MSVFFSMSVFDALTLGLIQGLTEFLPVSSSGHLQLGQYLLGFKTLQNYLLFDLVCHIGTLCSIFYFFWSELKNTLRGRDPLFWQILIGTLPLFPLVFLLKPIKAFFDSPESLGYCFLFTSFLLFSSLSIRVNTGLPPRVKNWLEPLTIGIFQSFALLPGVSRSGSTISIARTLGWTKEKAMVFSFMLAIPAILGATILESWHYVHMGVNERTGVDIIHYFIGFMTSFIVGCAALSLLQRLILEDKWKYFAWYCLFLGLITIFYFNINS